MRTLLVASVLLGLTAQWTPSRAASDTQDHLSFSCDRANSEPVTVSGAAGASLAAGDVLTGSAVRSLIIRNGVVQVSHEYSNSDQRGAHFLRRKNASGQYQLAVSNWYGDWTFYASPFKQDAVAAHILRATPDVVEVAWEFDHWLNHPGGYTNPYNPSEFCYLPYCGVPERDHKGVAVFVHNGGDRVVIIRRIKFVKTIRVERCAEGYFVGYHADPPLTPKNGLAGNNENSWGEREFGTGGGNEITWSSAGLTVRHPGQTQHIWMGIDDPPYAPYASEQLEGPWYVADIPRDLPFIRFVALEHRLETGVWAFNIHHLGTTVVHYVNDEIEATGMPGRYQLFFGAIPYISPDKAAEPEAGADGLVRSAQPTTWPN